MRTTLTLNISSVRETQLEQSLKHIAPQNYFFTIDIFTRLIVNITNDCYLAKQLVIGIINGFTVHVILFTRSGT